MFCLADDPLTFDQVGVQTTDGAVLDEVGEQ